MPATRKPAASTAAAEMPEAESGWWSRLLGAKPGRSANVANSGRSIRIEVRQLDKTISIDWPLEGADQCREWLRELMK